MVDGLGLYVNNQIFTATTSAVPTNWDELRKTAFSLTIRDRQGQITRAGVAMGTTNNVAHWPDILAALMLQNSVDLTKPDATVDAKGRNLGADALRFYTIFTTEDRTWDDTLPPDIIAFANGKVAMILAPSWEAHAIRQMSPKLDFSIYPFPQLSSQRKVTWASYWAEGVSKNSKHKKEAWKFLKYLSSKEALQLMYAETSKTRAFGEIYPRRDMAGSLQDAKYVGTFVGEAPDATSWYMSSGTFDNGINDEIISYYQNAVNAITSQQRSSPESAIATVAKGVQQVLAKYRVVK
jgi:ABC-type glycerol-3-phosphate transport system substrate-binding protein